MKMGAESQTWVGSFKSLLTRVETTHQPRPDGPSVVEIPRGLERLRSAIVACQNDLVEAQAERGDYIQAWSDCQQEINAHLAKNTTRQRDLTHRLERLRREWLTATVDLGIRAEIVPEPIDDRLPADLQIAMLRPDNETGDAP
jgi:hypothetical protein